MYCTNCGKFVDVKETDDKCPDCGAPEKTNLIPEDSEATTFFVSTELDGRFGASAWVAREAHRQEWHVRFIRALHLDMETTQSVVGGGCAPILKRGVLLAIEHLVRRKATQVNIQEPRHVQAVTSKITGEIRKGQAWDVTVRVVWENTKEDTKGDSMSGYTGAFQVRNDFTYGPMAFKVGEELEITEDSVYKRGWPRDMRVIVPAERLHEGRLLSLIEKNKAIPKNDHPRIVDLNALGAEIVANRKRRNWPSATDLSRTTLGLAEEVGEFETARRKYEFERQALDELRESTPKGHDFNATNMVEARREVADALTDIMVYCLGAFNMIGEDADDWLAEVVIKNKGRSYESHH